jgi:putative transposase
MMKALSWLVAFLVSGLKQRRELALENLALRQQLGLLKRAHRRPQLRRKDRLFWVWLSEIWTHWREALLIVSPDTVVRWHRKGIRLYWKWTSRRNPSGRPATSPKLRALIRQMAAANPLWGAPRIHGELLKLGIDLSQRTVSRLMPKHRQPPSQSWKTFLDNHVQELVSLDFFTVPTARFRVLFVLVLLSHHRRRVLHFNVTEHPTAFWTAQQMIEAFPEGSTPGYLIRDRDKVYGDYFRQRVKGMQIEEVMTAPQSPWQSPYVERLIGSIRRECLDHAIVLGQKHLRHMLISYFEYYDRSRTHLSLGKDAPEPRPVQPPEWGEVIQLPLVGGLHHRYQRRAA